MYFPAPLTGQLHWAALVPLQISTYLVKKAIVPLSHHFCILSLSPPMVPLPPLRSPLWSHHWFLLFPKESELMSHRVPTTFPPYCSSPHLEQLHFCPTGYCHGLSPGFCSSSLFWSILCITAWEIQLNYTFHGVILYSGSTRAAYQSHVIQGSQHIPFHTSIFSLSTTTVSDQPNFSPFPFHTAVTLWGLIYESILTLSFRQINTSYADVCTCLCYGSIQKFMKKDLHDPIFSQMTLNFWFWFYFIFGKSVFIRSFSFYTFIIKQMMESHNVRTENSKRNYSPILILPWRN